MSDRIVGGEKGLAWRSRLPLCCVAIAAAAFVAGSTGGEAPSAREQARRIIANPVAVVTEEPQVATLYATGEEVVTEWETIWRPMCGSMVGALGPNDLQTMADEHDRQFGENGDLIIIDRQAEGGVAGAGINIVFSLSASVPSAAISAISAAEAYLESLFSDPITVTISVSYQNLGSGVLGSTGSSYTSASWTTSRNGLVNGMDANDTIQSSLPTGSTIAVRYNGNSPTITTENTIFWTRAAYRSTVGSVAGNAASMTFNSAFGWDYNPTNGVNGYSFRDVIIHEVGHALGFTSSVDFGTNDLDVMDVYRFPNLDGSADYDPDTLAEFTARPRLQDFNVPNDQHITDFISVEYRMSDGTPYQGSHFREQSNPNIGLMDPALGFNQTFQPNYFSTADLAVFDAIGYNR